MTHRWPDPRLRGSTVAASLALLALGVAAGCGQKIQQQYNFTIIGPRNVDYLAGATAVALDVGGREISRASVSDGVPFSLSGGGVDPNVTLQAAIGVRALDGSGNLVAFGQTPVVELTLTTPMDPLRIFVQKPGTFGQWLDMDAPARGLFAVAVNAVPSSTDVRMLPVSVALYGTGLITVKNAMNVSSDVPTDVLNIYNPLVHLTDDGGNTGALAGVGQPRTDVATLVRPDGNTVYVFGGDVTPSMQPTKATSQLDVLQVVRANFDLFQTASAIMDARTSDKPGVARSRTVMAEANGAYAFGGQANGQELDSVLAIDASANDAFQLLDLHMGCARVGHSATSVTSAAAPQVLVFGGQHCQGPVAEIFLPESPPKMTPPAGNAGPPRWDHVAVPLPPDRVLILGGATASGPLADSLLYTATDRTLAPGPITLKIARSAFAAFIVGQDLVIAGGLGAAGPGGQPVPLGNAEVYDASNPQFPFKAMIPAHARSHAVFTVLSNESAVVLGGIEAGGASSNVTEIYQPFR
jgi:hypothetical protein